ncbi:hypothetical protein HK099_007272, partial [Clydaea vesicula]
MSNVDEQRFIGNSNFISLFISIQENTLLVDGSYIFIWLCYILLKDKKYKSGNIFLNSGFDFKAWFKKL